GELLKIVKNMLPEGNELPSTTYGAKKMVPAKLMWYFPIIPRLKRFFKNKDNVKLMRWHKEDRKEDHMIRHPADGSQWRNLNRDYPQFDNDPRNIRFAYRRKSRIR